MKSAAGLAGLSVVAPGFAFVKAAPLLSFSTLGCPDWSYDKILKYAADNRYGGIEIRGILDQMDLPLCPEFSTAGQITASRKKAEAAGVRIVGLGASAKLHLADAVQRKANLDEARRFIDLAGQLNCPYVRVFPNDLPKDQDRDTTIRLITDGLLELGKYADGKGVTVLLESHGQVVGKDILHRIMSAARHPNTGLIWDIFNMWSVTKESPAEVYALLKDCIRHVHVKDAVQQDGKWHYVQVGEGTAPLTEALTALTKGGYKGYYSFEWEKRWHPDIEAPEVVIPAYPAAFGKLFAAAKKQ